MCVLCVCFLWLYVVGCWLQLLKYCQVFFSPPPTTTICTRSRCGLPREGWQRRQVSARAQTAAAPVLPKRWVQAVVILLLLLVILLFLFVCCCFWPFFAKFVLFFVVVAALYANLQLFFCLLLLMLFCCFSLQSCFNEFYIYTKHYLIIIMEKTNNKEHTFCGAQK